MILPPGEEDEDSLLLLPFLSCKALMGVGVLKNGRRFEEQGWVTLVLPAASGDDGSSTDDATMDCLSNTYCLVDLPEFNFSAMYLY